VFLHRLQSQDLLTAGQPESQHFSNHVKYESTDSSFESVRLRILWNMNMGHDGMQWEIKMVDLDLLSFFGLDSRVHSARSASNGLSIEDRSTESATRTYCASHFTVTDSKHDCNRFDFPS